MLLFLLFVFFFVFFFFFNDTATTEIYTLSLHDALPISAIMARINRLVCLRSPTGQFATFFLAAVSERDLTLNFTNAGHNFPILFRAGGERRMLETGGLVVGMLEGAT